MKVKTQSFSERRLTIKELGWELKNAAGEPRGRGYVHAMVKMGFKLRKHKAKLSDAIKWLEEHPGFSWRRAYIWKRGQALTKS